MRAALLVSLVALSSCTPSLVDYEARVHVVRPGETLYTIAWQHGVDYRELARWNGIDNPDLIFVGQRIALRPGTAAARPASSRPASPPPRAVVAPPAALPDVPPPTWQWPTRGDVVGRFASGEGIDSGIAIAGQSGQPVVAAAAGRIVYSGTGLIGYGQLIIIKHNDTYLSAYGHTQDVRVSQGQQVNRGEQIAAMGLGPERQPQLHFEIRKNGKPVDPLSMLPRS